MITGTIGDVLTLIGLGWFFHTSTAFQHANPSIALALIMAYLLFFEISLGPIFWVMIAEIYPLRSRGEGHGCRHDGQLDVQLPHLLLLPHHDQRHHQGWHVLAIRVLRRGPPSPSSPGNSRRPRTAASRTSNVRSTGTTPTGTRRTAPHKPPECQFRRTCVSRCGSARTSAAGDRAPGAPVRCHFDAPVTLHEILPSAPLGGLGTGLSGSRNIVERCNAAAGCRRLAGAGGRWPGRECVVSADPRYERAGLGGPGRGDGALTAVRYYPGSLATQQAGRMLVVISGAAAWLTAGATVLQHAWGRTIIPLGPGSKRANMPLAQASDPIAHPVGPPGVRIGQ